MNKKEFAKLQVGDYIYHPHTGEVKIEEIETAYNTAAFEEAGGMHDTRIALSDFEETFAITVAGGNRMKIDDRAVSETRLCARDEELEGMEHLEDPPIRFQMNPARLPDDRTRLMLWTDEREDGKSGFGRTLVEIFGEKGFVFEYEFESLKEAIAHTGVTRDECYVYIDGILTAEEPEESFTFRALYADTVEREAHGQSVRYARLLPITTVIAKNHLEAAERIEEELKRNPSRARFLQLWRNSGSIVVRDGEFGEIASDK